MKTKTTKPKISTIIIKAAIIAVIVIVGNIFVQTISPTIANDLAMQQMNNSADSSAWIYTYSYLLNYAWVIPTILTILLFRKELVYIFNKTKSTLRGETENEEN